MVQRELNSILPGVVFGVVILLGGALGYNWLSARFAAQAALASRTRSTPTLPATQSPAALVITAPALEPRFPRGYNFALATHGGKVSGGVHPEQLIDGNTTNYDGGSGYGHTQWRAQPPGSFLIELKEPSEIDCVRFLLWDLEENRYYRYKLEAADASPAKSWTVIADKTGNQEECRSWQVLRFEKRTVKLLRLTGTFNSANSGFHVVEFQACLAPADGFPLEPKPQPPQEKTVQDDLQF